MKTNPNDSAFANSGNTLTDDNVETYSSGLTKREYFAAIAMQAYLSNPVHAGKQEASLAEWSVEAADALITELNKAK